VAQIVSFARPLRAARLDAELAVATDAARHAGRLQMERYERLERIVHKSEHDVVTEVDTLSETLIMNAIHEAFPNDSILAEESGRTDVVGDAEGPELAVDQRVWIVDPLDGTVNYANGIPAFCVSVGLAIGGRPMIGVVYDPTRENALAHEHVNEVMIENGFTPVPMSFGTLFRTEQDTIEFLKLTYDALRGCAAKDER